jgi:hypothetical protein
MLAREALAVARQLGALLGATLRKHPARVVVLTLSSIAAPMLQLAVFALAFRGLGSDAASDVLAQYALPAGLVLAAVLGVSAWLAFTSDRVRERIAIDFAKSMSIEVMATIAGTAALRVPGDDAATRRANLNRLLRSDPLFVGRMLVRILGMFVPTCALVALLSILAYENLQLTVMVSALGAIVGLGFVRLLRRATATSRDLERIATEANVAFARATNPLELSTGRHAAGRRIAETEIFGEGAAERLFDQFAAVHLLDTRSRLLTDSASALILAVCLASWSLEGDFSAQSLAALSVYLIALRTAFGYANGLASDFVMVMRFYPQLMRQQQFFRDNPITDEAPPAQPRDHDAGACIALRSAEGVTRYTLEWVATSAAKQLGKGFPNWSAICMLSASTMPLPTQTAGEFLQFDAARAEHLDPGLRTMWDRVIGPDGCIATAAWQSVDMADRLRLMIGCALLGDKRCLLLRRSELGFQASELLSGLRQSRPDLCLIILYGARANGTLLDPDLGEDTVVDVHGPRGGTPMMSVDELMDS